MGDDRLHILAEARRALDEQGGSPVEREYLLKLLDILTAALGNYSPESIENSQHLTSSLDVIHFLAIIPFIQQLLKGDVCGSGIQDGLQPLPGIAQFCRALAVV